jgi:hypothetical protein
MKKFAIGVLAVVGLVVTASAAMAGDLESKAEDDYVALSARDAEKQRRSDAESAPDSENRLIEWLKSPWCGQGGYGPEAGWLVHPCADGVPDADAPECGDDEPQPPYWSRTRESPQSAWGPWMIRTGWYCAVDVLPEFTTADFRVLPIPPSPLAIQPDRGWVLVNKPTIAYSSGEEQTLKTEVLGVGVTVVVKPESFTWDFGGENFTTKGPGRPYPDQDVTYVFRELGTERVRLTTTWSGRYQVEGDSRWRDVDGTATTTSTSPSFEVVERRSVLVNRD